MAHLNSHGMMHVRTAGPLMDSQSIRMNTLTVLYVTHGLQEMVLPPNSQLTMNYAGSATRLKKRNISEKTCEKFKIYRDGDTLRFHYHNADGQCIGAKTRSKSTSNSSYEGDMMDHFFGQHLWKGSGKRITITEGELDVLATLIAPTWAVVSLPTGAAGQQRSRFRRTTNFFKATKRSSFSLITMKQARGG